jgi:hypothetical protein
VREKRPLRRPSPPARTRSRTPARRGQRGAPIRRCSRALRTDPLQSFYRDVLGCYVGKGPEHPGGPEDTDLIRFANGFSIVVQYTDSALGEAELKRSIWLEVQTDNADQLARKIEAFGIHAFDYFDKDHFYFQAPGGQVFRVAGK